MLARVASTGRAFIFQVYFIFLFSFFFPSYAAIMDVLFLAYELKHALEFHEIRVRGIGVSELFEFRISYYLP